MPRKASRTQEVLWLITKYGVISTKVLRMIISNPIGARWLRQMLAKLEARGLIVNATSNIAGSPVDYWMLSKEGIAIARSSQITGLEKDKIRSKSSKYTHYPHEDLCTLFQVSVERQMPSITVLREATGGMNKLPDLVLSQRLRRIGYAPDLILCLPSAGSDTELSRSPKWIAVEIDRTYRSMKRLSQRVNMYARHTGFDALLYLMPTKVCLQTLMDVFERRGAGDAFRIKGTEKSFLGCGVSAASLFDVNIFKILVSGKSVPLSTWLSIVALTNKEKRDLSFQRYSSTGEYLNTKALIRLSD